jgi:hypothetical protein
VITAKTIQATYMITQTDKDMMPTQEDATFEAQTKH